MKIPGRLVGEAGEYQIRLDSETWCCLEALTGRPAGEVMDAVAGPAPTRADLVAVLRAIIVEPPDQTDDQVLAIVADLGGWAFLAESFANPAIAEIDRG